MLCMSLCMHAALCLQQLCIDSECFILVTVIFCLHGERSHDEPVGGWEQKQVCAAGVTTEQALLSPDNHIQPDLYTNALPDMLSVARAAVPA